MKILVLAFVGLTILIVFIFSKSQKPLTHPMSTYNQIIPTPTEEIQSSTKDLSKSWKAYKTRFITEGKVYDPQSQSTTSEGQAYAMLRAVWMNDEETFYSLWNWTAQNLQVRVTDKLFSWQYKDNAVTDKESAADGDIDIAAALLLASKIWNKPLYRDAALEIISDIWKKEVVIIANRFVLVANTNPRRSSGFLVNPSYFSPAWYRMFAEVDTEHQWDDLVVNTYQTLNDISLSNVYGLGQLVPDWVIVTPSGKILSAERYMTQEVQYYGYDAFRTYFRVAHDVIWNQDENGMEILKIAVPVFEGQWKRSTSFPAVSFTNGAENATYTDPTTAVGALSVFFATHNPLTEEVYLRFESEYDPTAHGWGETDNYYRQNWAWFGTALVTNQFPDIWKIKK